MTAFSTNAHWQPLSSAAARARRRWRQTQQSIYQLEGTHGLDPAYPFTSEALETTFPVAERFTSINGEGVHAGRLAAFIRFSGCNLSCSYCDTRWACDTDCTVAFYSVDELTAWVAQQPVACVTITGGEPTLQGHLPELVDALCKVPGIEVVEIETNGSVDLAPLVEDRPEELQITMDYKLPSSGMEDHMLLENFALLGKHDMVKFVVGTHEDLETMARVVRTHALDERCRVYISPVFGKLEPAAIVDFMKANALTRATLQLQLHKIIWPHIERGV